MHMRRMIIQPGFSVWEQIGAGSQQGHVFIWLQAVWCWSESYQTGNGVGPKHSRLDTACPHSACLSVLPSFCLTFIRPPAVQRRTPPLSHLCTCCAALPSPLRVFWSFSPCQAEKPLLSAHIYFFTPNVFCFSHTVSHCQQYEQE